MSLSARVADWLSQVVEPLRRRDVEAGRLFVVKRARSDELLALLLELDAALSDDRCEVVRGLDLRDPFLRDLHPLSSPLLCTQRLEGHVLQAPDFRLEKPQVHERLATVVLARDVVEPGTGDREDRHPAPVRAAHLDARSSPPRTSPKAPRKRSSV